MRDSRCLNGLWDFCPGSGAIDVMPQSWETEKIIVPSPWNINAFSAPLEMEAPGGNLLLKGGEFNLYPQYPVEWESAESGWYKTEFTVPEDWRGGRVTLRFDAVLYYSEYFVNGVHAASGRDGYLPLEFDVTEFIKWGESNSLVVGAVKLSALRRTLESGEKRHETPTGSFWGEMGGIWQDVFLNVYPPDSIGDLFVMTDIHAHKLTVKSEICGRWEDAVLEYSLIACDSGESWPLGAGRLQEREAKHVFDYSEIQSKITLWSPESPRLYQLEARLVRDGIIIDCTRVRFGFRSFEIRGKKFYLNGTPINLRSDSWHYMGFSVQTEEYARLFYQMEKEAHINCVRLHAQPYPAFFLDIADEMGMLIIDESALWASHTEYYYSEKLFENTEEHLERLVRRDRNHPSIVIWSVENECVPAWRVLGVPGNGDLKSEAELHARLFALGEHVKRFDPTRICSFDGGNDLGGLAALYNLHYPSLEHDIQTDKPLTLGELGNMYYSSPDMVCALEGDRAFLSFNGRLEAIGREAFAMLRHYRKYAAQTCIFNMVWYGLEPMLFAECIHSYGAYDTPGVKPTKTGPYISTLNAGYDPALPAYVANPLYHWAKSAFQPERFFFEDENLRFYSSETGEKLLSVHNDSLEKRDYMLRWSLKASDSLLFEDSAAISVEPSEYVLHTIRFELPAAPEDVAACELRVRLYDSVRVVFEDFAEIKVYNRSALQGKLARAGRIGVLGYSGPAFDTDNLVALRETEIDGTFDGYVVAGEISSSAYEELLASATDILDISLACPYAKPWTGGVRAGKAFVCEGAPEVMDGLEKWDLNAWRGELANRCLTECAEGNYVPILATGKAEPLAADFHIGQTRMTVCCIDLLRHMEREPAALTLLANLVNRLGGKRAALAECVAVTADDSALSRFLQALKVQFSRVDPSDKAAIKALRNARTLIADGEESLRYLDELLPHNAGTVLIWGMRPDTIPHSLRHVVRVTPEQLFQLQKVRKHRTVNGLWAADLYGLKSGQAAQIADCCLKITDKARAGAVFANVGIDWRMWNDMPENLKTIAILRSEREEKDELCALIECRVNGVETLVCQLGHDSANAAHKKLARILLTNLGVLMARGGVPTGDALNADLYDSRLKKALVLACGSDMPAGARPLLNNAEQGVRWSVADPENPTSGGKPCRYAFYVWSPADRTNLLRNPDLIEAAIQSKGHHAVYLNNEQIAEGSDIFVGAFGLVAGWNEVAICSIGQCEENSPLTVSFSRKNGLPLDLKFSIEGESYREISPEPWQLSSNFNGEACKNAVLGEGFCWDTVAFQSKGMYLQVDLGAPHVPAKLCFSSTWKDEHGMLQYGMPKGFVLQSSLDGRVWREVFSVDNEDRLTPIEGAFILYPQPVQARFLRLELTDLALKSLRVSCLKIYSAE